MAGEELALYFLEPELKMTCFIISVCKYHFNVSIISVCDLSDKDIYPHCVKAPLHSQEIKSSLIHTTFDSLGLGHYSQNPNIFKLP